MHATLFVKPTSHYALKIEEPKIRLDKFTPFLIDLILISNSQPSISNV